MEEEEVRGLASTPNSPTWQLCDQTVCNTPRHMHNLLARAAIRILLLQGLGSASQPCTSDKANLSCYGKSVHQT